MEDCSAHRARPEEGASVATTGEKEPSSLDGEAVVSNSLGADACSSIPGTALVPSSELLKLATHESIADDHDSIGSSVVPNGEEEQKEEEQPICAEDLEEDDATNMRAEDVPTNICSEDGIATQLSHIEELSHTEETSPALGGNTSEAPDQRPASHRRRRRGRQWHHDQTWWNDDAWRHGSEPWYPRTSQWQRATVHAWRPKD